MTSLSGEDHSVYIRLALFASMKCVSVEKHVFLNYCLAPPQPHPHHFSKLNFNSEIWNFTAQINAHKEGTKVNTAVTERVLKNLGTCWNIRHRWFQVVPVSFSLAQTLFIFGVRNHGPRSTIQYWGQIYKISYDNLTIIPKLRSTYDGRLIYKNILRRAQGFS